MPNDLHEDGVSDEVLDADAAFYHELGEDLYKKTIPLLNDVLSKLLTASIAMSGGTVFFLGDRTYPAAMKIAAVVMFLLAFGICLVGVIPLRAPMSYNLPAQVKEGVANAIWWKDAMIRGAATFIFLGVSLAAIGFFLV